jgi:hypothetical protein
MRLRVGLTFLNGNIEEYSKRFDLLELRADPRRLPSEKALRRLRATAGERVDISLLVPAETTRLALETPAELQTTLALATALDPAWVVFQTGPSLGPSARVRARVEAMIGALRQPNRRIGWEPRGPFEPEVAREWCNAFDITLVEDLSQVDEAEQTRSMYTRLRAQGAGARLASGALERLAELISSAEEAFIVIEGRPTPKARARVRQAVESQLGLEAADADMGAEAEEDDDEELDDEELGEDDLEQDELDGEAEDGEDSEDDEEPTR